MRAESVFQLGRSRDPVLIARLLPGWECNSAIKHFFTLCIQLYVPKAVPNGVQMFLRLSCHREWAGEATTENFSRKEGKSRHLWITSNERVGDKNHNQPFLCFHQSLLLYHEGKMGERQGQLGPWKLIKHENSQKGKKRRKQRLWVCAGVSCSEGSSLGSSVLPQRC